MNTKPIWLKLAALTLLVAFEWHAVARELGSPKALSERVGIRPGITKDTIFVSI